VFPWLHDISEEETTEEMQPISAEENCLACFFGYDGESDSTV
jgi:hypothetical protein